MRLTAGQREACQCLQWHLGKYVLQAEIEKCCVEQIEPRSNEPTHKVCPAYRSAWLLLLRETEFDTAEAPLLPVADTRTQPRNGGEVNNAASLQNVLPDG